MRCQVLLSVDVLARSRVSCPAWFSFVISMAGLSEAAIFQQMSQWGFPNARSWEIEYAREWYDRSHRYAVFATSIIFPFNLQGRAGLVCAVSTAESTRIQQRHPPGIEITHPGWLHYTCYFCPGLCMLNWQGMTGPEYGASQDPLGILGDLLDKLCAANGMRDWRNMFAVVRNGPYLGGLRNLLRRLGVPVWLELASGSSRRIYAGLDVFVRVFAGAYEAPEEARYILYDRDAADVSSRRRPSIEDWYYFQTWESCGQALPNFEYVVDDYIELTQAVVLQSAKPVSVGAQRRMDVMLSHLQMTGGPPSIDGVWGTHRNRTVWEWFGRLQGQRQRQEGFHI